MPTDTKFTGLESADFLLEEKENLPKYNKDLNMSRKKNETTFLSIISHKNM